MRATLTVVTLAIALVTCTKKEPVADPKKGAAQHEVVSDDFAREEIAKRIKGLDDAKAQITLATNVVEFRVVSSFNEGYEDAKTKPRFKGYALLAQREVPVSEVAELVAILTNPRSFEPPGHESTCLPDPGYILSFERSGQPVEIVVCFACGDMWINGVPGLTNVTLPMTSATSHALWKHVETFVARGRA